MTPQARPRSTRATQPLSRLRRVKRGIVAGYIHDISPRHRADERQPAATVPTIAAAPTAR